MTQKQMPSYVQLHVMRLMYRFPALTGAALAHHSGDVVARNGIYITLKRMLAKKLIRRHVVAKIDGNPRYSLTAAGRRYVQMLSSTNWSQQGKRPIKVEE